MSSTGQRIEEERINELKDRATEITQYEQWEIRWKGKTCGAIKEDLTLPLESQHKRKMPEQVSIRGKKMTENFPNWQDLNIHVKESE